MKSFIKSAFISVLALVGATSCTNLDEEVYDQIMSTNYYQTSDDIIRAYVRPFEHSYWSITSLIVLQENSADQIATYNRNGDWLDGQYYQRYHYHTWTIDDSDNPWVGAFQGISQCCSVIDDFNALDPEQFGYSREQFDAFICGLRTLRAWLYLNAFDAYRNIPLMVSAKDTSLNSEGQVEPQVMFDFIEKELKECIQLLPVKQGSGGNGVKQGEWNKAGAAALLVRLYLNAEKYIGKAMYTECAKYAQDIIDGVYGSYDIASRWDAPFDWNNDQCEEVFYAFSGAYGYAHWQYDSGSWWWGLPGNAHLYFGFKDWGMANPKFALQPSLDIDGTPYTYELGRPVAKYKKYPEDCRLKCYKNLPGESKREGMFLHGYLEYTDDEGNVKRITNPKGDYTLYIRDKVGIFNELPPEQDAKALERGVSNMNNGDHNSGWHLVKYPFYRDGDPGAIEADYALIRLAEIYYSLAECKFRAGDTEGAGKLLNTVRKRYYPSEKYTEYLYKPEGNVTLTEAELLDEWGREFIGELRRRTDLIRWNKYCQGKWWDKEPDADTHTELFPLHRNILGANLKLKQNPGYEDIAR